MNDKTDDRKRCDGAVEVFSRVTGFYRPVQNWNKAKREEFRQRKPYDVQKAVDATPEPPHNGREDIQYDGWPKP